MNYDPDFTSDGSPAHQTVKLTFGLWEYRAEITVEVDGSFTGLTVIEVAVGMAYQQLPKFGDVSGPMVPGIEMSRIGATHEDLLDCRDEDEKGEDWLKAMLIAAEIVAIRPVRDHE